MNSKVVARTRRASGSSQTCCALQVGVCCINACYTCSHCTCRAVPESPVDTFSPADTPTRPGKASSASIDGESAVTRAAVHLGTLSGDDDEAPADAQGDADAELDSLRSWRAHAMLALQETLLAGAVLFQVMSLLGGPVSRCSSPQLHS